MPVADLVVHGRVQGVGGDLGHLVYGRVQGVDRDLNHGLSLPLADLFVHSRVPGVGRDLGHLVRGRVQGVDWDLSHLVMTRVCTCHANQRRKGIRAYVFPLMGLVCQWLTWLCRAEYKGLIGIGVILWQSSGMIAGNGCEQAAPDMAAMQ